jgi:hypothetical protein
MLALLTLALFLGQDTDARLQSVVNRAVDLDPFIRAEAVAEASRLSLELGAPLAESRKVPAMIVAALAGKRNGVDLLRLPDRDARLVACDVLLPTKELLPELLELIGAKDVALRVAACRALGRIDDPDLRKTVSSALGHGMRRTGDADILFALISSFWNGNVSSRLLQINDSDPGRAALALTTLCNTPSPALSEGFAPQLVRALDNEKIDRAPRERLIHVLGRRSPASLCPLLVVRDRRLRADIVDVLDRFLTDPLDAPAVAAAARIKDADLAPRIDAWLARLCGEGVTSKTFAAWAQANYRIHVDRRADAAVAKGVVGLQKLCENRDSWKSAPGGMVGLSAFAAYALLKSGVAPDDPGVARCLDTLLERDPQGIYATSLAALALATGIERVAPRRERLERRLQTIADILVASQLKSGGWSYVARGPLDPLAEGWTYDLSNTQFALLGLRAAANGGARVPRAAWERAQLLLERVQLEDGGWGYSGREEPAYPRMTAAGASSWILCRISLDEQVAPAVAADSFRVRNATRWLDRAAMASQMSTLPDYYLLYSLERLCMIAGIEKLGTCDWYVEGATLLARAQGLDGAWRGAQGAVPDTCMALLFLRKAFVARPDVPTESGGKREK